jgi:hypothetical protein
LYQGIVNIDNRHVMISHQYMKAISTTNQTIGSRKQTASKNGYKQDAKWKQDESKSMEHARRDGFAIEALMPLGWQT